MIVSSTDGYCSIVTFSENEFGTPYIAPETNAKEFEPEAVPANLPPSFQSLLQGEILQENVQPTTSSGEDFHLAYEDSHMTIEVSPKCPPVPANKEKQASESAAATPSAPISQRTPKRVQLITLSKPSSE